MCAPVCRASAIALYVWPPQGRTTPSQLWFETTYYYLVRWHHSSDDIKSWQTHIIPSFLEQQYVGSTLPETCRYKQRRKQAGRHTWSPHVTHRVAQCRRHHHQYMQLYWHWRISTDCAMWIHGTSRINKSWQSRLNIARMWVKGSTADDAKETWASWGHLLLFPLKSLKPYAFLSSTYTCTVLNLQLTTQQQTGPATLLH